MRDRARSFVFAGRGVRLGARGRNMQVQIVGAAVVLALVTGYAVTGVSLAVVVLCTALVLSAELVNTAIEKLCDLVDELHGLGRDQRIGDVKDLAAGAVLVAAAGAAIVGAIVFGPLLV